MKGQFLVVCIILVLAGCSSTFSEKHYFRSIAAQGNTINYYRVGVYGYTLLASARYLSGYFDENVVDAYFNQISQTEKAT